jgi:hypothetical protein
MRLLSDRGRERAVAARSAPLNPRRSDFDITNTVRVSSAPDVARAVVRLVQSTWPGVVAAVSTPCITTRSIRST